MLDRTRRFARKSLECAFPRACPRQFSLADSGTTDNGETATIGSTVAYLKGSFRYFYLASHRDIGHSDSALINDEAHTGNVATLRVAFVSRV